MIKLEIKSYRNPCLNILTEKKKKYCQEMETV